MTEHQTRTLLIVGPALSCAGIAWTAIAPSDLASAAVLVGLLSCFYAAHRFGRLGPPESAAPSPSSQQDDA